MAMRCPCTNHLYYISTYISPSRQQKSILQLCRSGYSHAFLPPKSCPWPSSTMCQTTESSNVRASFNLVKVFFCFFFLELEEGQTYTMNLVATAVGQRWCANAHKGEVSYILAAGVRRGADAKAIVGERRTVATSTWVVPTTCLYLYLYLYLGAEPWSPPLASCTNGISDDRKFKSASCVGASSIWNLCNLDISTAKFRTALLNPFFVDRFYIQTQKCISRHNATWLNCFCRMIFALLQISFKDYSYTRTKHWFSNIAS